MLLVGGILVLRGRLTLGVLLVLLAYLQQLYGPMKSLARLSSVIAKGQAGAERVEEVLRATTVVRERPDAVEAPVLRGEVELRDVHFGYDPARPVLNGVSLHVPAGQVVALAGSTGAGKSTIVSLVPRLYDVTDGAVLVDGRDVREFTLSSLRRQIAVVLQQPLMVTGSILDNIAFGAPAATREELLEAAEAAYVDEFVSQLPDGYDTPVAEGGVSLSGGQRQRISIARALATRRARRDARRAHQRSRRGQRGAGDARPGGAHGPAHRPRRRAPPVDAARRRPGVRRGARPRRGRRHPPGAVRPRRDLPRHERAAAGALSACATATSRPRCAGPGRGGACLLTR